MKHQLNEPQKEFSRVQRDWLNNQRSHAHSHFVLHKPLNKFMHVLACGEGEPVLMLHGGNAFSALWEPLLVQLKTDFRLLAPDRFSCGLSDVIDYKTLDLYQYSLDFLDAVFDHYQLSSAHIIGNSLGGYWALLYAMARPERVKKIVLIGAPGGTQAPPFVLRLASVPLLNQLLFFILMNRKNSTERLFQEALVADVKHVPDDIYRLMHLGLRLPGAQKAWLDILEMTCTLKNIKPEFWLFDQLNQIQQPTLLLWGDKDVFGNPKQAQAVANALPQSQLVMIKNAGHMPWLDQDVECARLIKAFLG